MTDNEIIKALEICTSENLGCEDGCPRRHNGLTYAKCRLGFLKDALDLINRQKAEIERLETVKKYIDNAIFKNCEYPTTESYNEAFQKALARLYDNVNAQGEVIKEFAERLIDIFPLFEALPKAMDIVMKEMGLKEE